MSFRALVWLNNTAAAVCLVIVWCTDSKLLVGVATWVALVAAVVGAECSTRLSEESDLARWAGRRNAPAA